MIGAGAAGALEFRPDTTAGVGDAAVVGRVAGGELPEGAEEVGDRPPAGREHRPDEERGEPLVRRAGEVEGENLDEGVRFGW